jgi:hypothetical protein
MEAALFLDTKIAYNNVHIDILVERLKETGFPGNLLLFILNLTSENYSSDMQNCSAGDGHTGDYPSPVLYELYTSELKEVINGECRISEFADDVAIYAVNRHHRMGVPCVEENAEVVQEYLGLRGLEIAPCKCQLCV